MKTPRILRRAQDHASGAVPPGVIVAIESLLHGAALSERPAEHVPVLDGLDRAHK